MMNTSQGKIIFDSIESNHGIKKILNGNFKLFCNGKVYAG